MIRFFPVALIALLSAGILTFCAPHPAHAQADRTASGKYIDCAQVAADVSLMAKAMQAPRLIGDSWEAGPHADWYTSVVVSHAVRAVKSNNPAQYVRDLHKACLLETA